MNPPRTGRPWNGRPILRPPRSDGTSPAETAEMRDPLLQEFSLVVRDVARKAWWLAPDPEERTQEVWVLLMDQIAEPGYDPGRGGFQHYVRLRLWRAALDRRRRSAALPPERLSGDAAERIPGREEEPRTAHEQERFRRLIREALGAFRTRATDADFSLLVLHWIEERSLADIARQLRQPAAQVRKRHHRAFARFSVFLRRRPWSTLFADWVP